MQPLLCTHKECFNRGVRFVYCAVCDLPVAHRNFSTRHCHPDLEIIPPRGEWGPVIEAAKNEGLSDDVAMKLTDTDIVDAQPSLVCRTALARKLLENEVQTPNSFDCDRRGNINNERKTLLGASNSTRRKMSPSASAAFKEAHSSVSGIATVDQAVEVSEDTTSTAAEQSLVARTGVSDSSSTAAVYAKKLKRSINKKRKRQDAWLDLLCNRPSDEDNQGDKMSAWLMAVNSISDPKWRPDGTDRRVTNNVLASSVQAKSTLSRKKNKISSNIDDDETTPFSSATSSDDDEHLTASSSNSCRIR